MPEERREQLTHFAKTQRSMGLSLIECEAGKIGAVMISSAEKRRDLRGLTLESLRRGCPPQRGDPMPGAGFILVLDDVVSPEVTRPQSRQEIVSLAAIEAGLLAGWDYFLFLEDDLAFNCHFAENLGRWEPLRDGVVEMASLYNPHVAGPNFPCPYKDTYLADPRRVYGSQAFLLSRQCAYFVARHWWEVPGMQDIKISRLAARLGPIFYHAPSLVQHVGTKSTWTENGRFHIAPDYSGEWRADGN